MAKKEVKIDLALEAEKLKTAALKNELQNISDAPAVIVPEKDIAPGDEFTYKGKTFVAGQTPRFIVREIGYATTITELLRQPEKLDLVIANYPGLIFEKK
jgi:hypothetical protein